MRIQIINPNTTASLTALSLAAGRAVAAPGTEIVARQPGAGTPSVECHVDEAIATLGIIEAVQGGEAEGVDAHVIACFGDTGLDAAREVARGPVVGMTEAALYAAALIAPVFAIVTLPRRTPVSSVAALASARSMSMCATARTKRRGSSMPSSSRRWAPSKTIMPRRSFWAAPVSSLCLRP